MGSVQLGVKALRDEKRAIVMKAMAVITSKGLMRRPTPRKSRVITRGLVVRQQRSWRAESDGSRKVV
jgi:hypothetical protein